MGDKKSSFSGKVIGIVIAAVIFITVGVIATAPALAAEAANWGTTGVALLVLVPLVMVAGFIFYMLREFEIV